MIPWLNPDDDADPFPNVGTALEDPNGLLAAGGSLQPERLLSAYRQGIFPWFEDGQPILWWSPNPRMALKPNELYLSRSLKKVIRRETYRCTINRAFDRVIAACSQPREDQDGTWITSSMAQAYQALHKLGHAHSIEVWLDEQLVGGLYGISIGQVFFGESMFSLQSNASKVGFAFLCEQLTHWDYQLIDCQVESEHLNSLGAATIERQSFIEKLNLLCGNSPSSEAWEAL
ncbi:MAG: leucyl/phenylalanyl-tRNA--protein transferase [Cycloclasticus sp. symbiont of Bathymodiolus heckerae]|nr:MAG: leucyl/phenylalanyl-tRNA--protein transferase [Cycloclasticus sp. symbiont of Bathymodiolus heckerae]